MELLFSRVATVAELGAHYCSLIRRSATSSSSSSSSTSHRQQVMFRLWSQAAPSDSLEGFLNAHWHIFINTTIFIIYQQINFLKF